MKSNEYHKHYYRSWYEFRRGTTDPDYPAWNAYGKWGVKMCREWRDSFHAFAAYVDDVLGPKPGPEYVLHRYDTTKDFKPGNLYWTTKLDLGNTRRTVRYVQHKGRKMSIKNWARELNLSHNTVYNRIYIGGWTPRQALGFEKR